VSTQDELPVSKRLAKEDDVTTNVIKPSVKTIWLKKNEDRRINSGHSWVFSNEIEPSRSRIESCEPGVTVEVRSDRDRFLGYAMVNPHSLICARLLSRVEGVLPDEAWLQMRILKANETRKRLGFKEHYRMVFGESDSLPGLIADRYGPVLVVQTATAWMEQRLGVLIEGFKSIDGIEQIVLKNDSRARAVEGLEMYVKPVVGELPSHLRVVEEDRSFEISISAAQKTGWFYDQRFNRQQFLPLIPMMGEALDVCSYAGGWAVALAKRGGRVTAIDASQVAIDHAIANGRLNDVEIAGIKGDAFEVMQGLIDAGRTFDTVVVDPPAFIQRRKDEHTGLAAYRKLNQMAIQLLNPEGYLISCSCSYHLATEMLPPIINRAAQFSARRVQIVAQGGQSPDHPVHPAIPETRYLKALLAYVTAEV
jgi:23S rRNA (cytosine1962-C5)-methyltransferase